MDGISLLFTAIASHDWDEIFFGLIIYQNYRQTWLYEYTYRFLGISDRLFGYKNPLL
jgi:hypothetical protein